MSEDWYVPGQGAGNTDAQARPVAAPAAEPEPAPSQEPQASAQPHAARRTPPAAAKAVAAVIVIAVAAAAGAGVMALAGGSDEAQEPVPLGSSAAASYIGPTFTFTIEAEGYDPQTSTPFVVTATGTTSGGAVVNASHAIGAGTSTWDLGEGSYTFSIVPAVNADGSTYSVPASASASPDGTVSLTATRIAARDVSASQAARIVAALEAAEGRVATDVPAGTAQRAESHLPEIPEQEAGTSQASAGSRACPHEWEVSTKDGEEVWIDGAPIYGDGEPIIEYHDICSCGIDLAQAGVSASYHLSTHASGAWSVTSDVPVIVGYQQVIVGYEQVFAGYQQIADGYVCSKCGEKKEVR